MVVGPYRRRRPAKGQSLTADVERAPEARLEEAVGLARAIELDVIASGIAPLSEIRPATYIGKGKVDELAGVIKGEEIGVVVMDCALSPVQQRNLEKAWGAKVLDRTGLILEIFGRRARTREGSLQVEHAHLTYQKGRLVRTWTHLERQRGGFGFLGGPGETQIESDRRMISERIAKIERELEGVKRTRKLHRDSRKRVPYPVVALVGYTNAGKSTLFNRLTRSGVMAADMLFATLDPTLRAITLPHGAKAILSDTVGFISDLPTMLVAAFRATLEEVAEADLVLHVIDAAASDRERRIAAVRAVLEEVGASDVALIEVYNKCDRLTGDEQRRLQEQDPETLCVSALTGDSVDELVDTMAARLGLDVQRLNLTFDPDDEGDRERMARLYRHARVLTHEARDGRVSIVADVPRRLVARIQPVAR